MRRKAKVLLAVLAYGGEHRAELGLWRALAAAWAATSPLIDDLLHVNVDCCPTPVSRHRVVKAALENGCDIILSIDGDTLPARGWCEFAIDWLIRAKRPALLGCPYVCAGDEERVQVFRWRTDRTGDVNELPRLDHYPREEAAYRTGTEDVACIGTGCFACHTEVFDSIPCPWFEYEYGDEMRTQVIATEDVHCIRDLAAAGVPIVAAWDYWATHFKVKALGKPAVLHPDEVWGRTAKVLKDRSLFAPERMPDPHHQAWFDYPELYDHLVHSCRPGGTVVEVGSWMGHSFTHLAATARAARKGVRCVSVDHGLGGPEHRKAVEQMGGSTAPHLARRIAAAGLTEDVVQLTCTSLVAAGLFADGSLDAVFIDADHKAPAVEQDVRAWLPKVRPGGLLCGHDWDFPAVKEGLRKAGVQAVQSRLSPSCWEFVVPGGGWDWLTPEKVAEAKAAVNARADAAAQPGACGVANCITCAAPKAEKPAGKPARKKARKGARKA